MGREGNVWPSPGACWPTGADKLDSDLTQTGPREHHVAEHASRMTGLQRASCPCPHPSLRASLPPFLPLCAPSPIPPSARPCRHPSHALSHAPADTAASLRFRPAPAPVIVP